MSESTTNLTVTQLKLRIQRQMLEQIALLSKLEPPQQAGMDTIGPLNFMVSTYVAFMSTPFVTWADDGQPPKPAEGGE